MALVASLCGNDSCNNGIREAPGDLHVTWERPTQQCRYYQQGGLNRISTNVGSVGRGSQRTKNLFLSGRMQALANPAH